MDKIDRLLDAIEHPDRYSEKEMEAMLADPEVREVYALLDKTKASLTPIAAPDVDAEWEAFQSSRRVPDGGGAKRRPAILSLFSRNIAASVAIVIASLAAVAAVVGVGVNMALDRKTESPAAEIAAVAKEDAVAADTMATAGEAPAAVPETVIFDNEPLEAIAARIAGYYGYRVEFAGEASRSLRLYFRWNQAQTLDEVAESLNNFGQIRITVHTQARTIIID